MGASTVLGFMSRNFCRRSASWSAEPRFPITGAPTTSLTCAANSAGAAITPEMIFSQSGFDHGQAMVLP